ncbi:MAG: DUF2202 domain-containing protein [Rhodoferax sp.]|jgi:hypothetical protein|uniref:DUF2202 domain-containing protein n=1 Tax=Rhodoferax sp. TaxID=50421 RepID=UPI001B623234|nr:DUF2202 domain-containing protein [Rhodoferax sp.]MBP9148732.1 DUF2202 domain-containing protein [Rhodoferax sp.]MBP9737090.1 DUF2202 domain-containing protein [Rhodoferax sp.]
MLDMPEFLSPAARQAHRAERVQEMRRQLEGRPTAELSDIECADLGLMREEEKIARDVYMQLFERWGVMPFGNISGSEQAHMDMVGLLLKRFGVSDAVAGLEVGHFATATMQALHDQLLAQGLQSLEDAVSVGLNIEELDIADLQLSSSHTRNPEILLVYGELERGSRNHLRAFYRWAQRLNVRYDPTHLSQADFERITRSTKEDCH